jgi:hypothetical protein
MRITAPAGVVVGTEAGAMQSVCIGSNGMNPASQTHCAAQPAPESQSSPPNA